MSSTTTVTSDQGSPIIIVERTFDAPREKVFAALTDPEKLKNWWSPWGTLKIELDLREGGEWRFSDVSGEETHAFFGRFHEITAPERIVQTEEYANLGERGHVILDKYELAEKDGKTHLTITMACLSVADRDAIMATGMTEGIVAQHEKLDALLEES